MNTKNFKDTLFYWKKHWILTLFYIILMTTPSIIFFYPIGELAEYENYKWTIYMYMICMLFVYFFHTIRIQSIEGTIEELNKEIEELKSKTNE